MIVIEHGPGGQAVTFPRAHTLLCAHTPDEVPAALRAAEQARRAGAWVAGYLAYEAGCVFEPRLRACLKHAIPGEPLVLLAVCDAPEPADAVLAQAAQAAGGAELRAPVPLIQRVAYDRAMARLLDYIAAGDCYQVNLTFPLEARLTGGTALGLYGALRARQQVGYGALIDLGAGPVVISRSPELFFHVTDGVIESRPMKGTAPRSDDPAEDARLAAALSASDKVLAENLMIVDLLRNDIGRISEIGSVSVPELFAVESFATVHQMSSRIRGRLRPGAGLGALMAALFPCGSVTGAPKIRAMQIIAELEPHPRGVYCGAIGWAAPDGNQCWSVAIRTLRLYPDGRVLANVGGGVVQDSTAAGEWEEALWKARFMQGLTRPG